MNSNQKIIFITELISYAESRNLYEFLDVEKISEFLLKNKKTNQGG